MALFTEAAVRANLRNREGRRVFYLGDGDRLTPGARDFLRDNHIELLPAEKARPLRYTKPCRGGAVGKAGAHDPSGRPDSGP